MAKFGMNAIDNKRILFFTLTLSLFVVGVFRANYHNSAVSFDNFAFVAHWFYRRSDFHFFSP